VIETDAVFTGRLEAVDHVRSSRVSGQLDSRAFPKAAIVQKATCCSRLTRGRGPFSVRAEVDREGGS